MNKEMIENLKQHWLHGYCIGMYHKGQMQGEYLVDVEWKHFEGKDLIVKTAEAQFNKSEQKRIY